ncbi:UvrB/UvrC motif-containing protein [Clostridium oceanicum]|uniref:UvrB/UvrC motif-containing protein n=1 Tax=Clostridium oceanicum TaxID=1543 RepID=A0ABN1JSZ7_9CLOT
MMCDRCNKNPATVHIVKIVNGKKEELNLCEKCANETQNITFNSGVDFVSPFSVQNILSGILDYMTKPQGEKDNYELKCSNCGTTYDEFKSKGLVGCSECYKSFDSSIIPIIKRIHGSTEHNGKIPKKSGESIIRRKKIDKFKKELQECVKREEYEKAAELRDKIKYLQEDNNEEG